MKREKNWQPKIRQINKNKKERKGDISRKPEIRW